VQKLEASPSQRLSQAIEQQNESVEQTVDSQDAQSQPRPSPPEQQLQATPPPSSPPPPPQVPGSWPGQQVQKLEASPSQMLSQAIEQQNESVPQTVDSHSAQSQPRPLPPAQQLQGVPPPSSPPPSSPPPPHVPGLWPGQQVQKLWASPSQMLSQAMEQQNESVEQTVS
jgi:hypothetical protein